MPKGRRRRIKVGDVFKVELGDGFNAFGVIAEGNDCAFFGLRTEHIPSIEEIARSRVIFRIPVAQDVLTSGKWPIVGNFALSGALLKSAAYRHQPVGSNQLFLYQSGESKPARIEDVENLELLAVWFDYHVIERLKDYFAQRPNRMVEQFRLIRRYDPNTGQELR